MGIVFRTLSAFTSTAETLPSLPLAVKTTSGFELSAMPLIPGRFGTDPMILADLTSTISRVLALPWGT